MSLCRNGRRSASLCIGLLLTLFVVALPTVGWAQIEKESKYDIFVGYQWVNPGGSVPSGALDANGLAVPYKVPSISPGFGLAGAYNFSRNWAMEVDYGGNFNDRATLNTLSAGPRYMWRGEGINIFAHTLLGLNRISPKNLASSSGIGAILGGGIDLPLREHFRWRLIEADYLWSRHNYADETTASDPLRLMVNLATDDIAADHARLATAGVPFTRAPEREPWGGWVATLADPDGNTLQLLQLPAPA